MEKLLNQILDELKELKENQKETIKRLDSIENKLDAINEQTADLTEFRTETKQELKDIKDTLKFIIHKEAENERDIHVLKQFIK
ncbi:hypothetical protein [Caloranaerobacter sp. DY30410]|uniref:hypothetical protein n=1 Tax=Caloranaerobacter sp. DY30410 TaxID=3238305 RepID=UPI003CFE1896